MAEALAPGQADELLKISHMSLNAESTQTTHEIMSNDMVQNLKSVYDFYSNHQVPFDEQVRLLALLPKSWSYEAIIGNFGASRHAIKLAHRMRDQHDYLLQRDSEPAVRQRADPTAIRHFVNWLVESNTLVSGHYCTL